ncbi:acetate--CoA ligase family protein [Candidatus Bathyarchaeota archaeon]|nr:acetate--CoA ligase family protein [Candidatus Bathyarchaeota archaeon]
MTDVMSSALEAMKGMFMPSSVAVVGASREPGKVGYSVVKNLIDGGYKGRVYPINPSAPEVLGLKAYTSIREVPETPDVAIIAIPAKYVAGTVAELGARGVTVAVIITSGFAEIGEKELQNSLIDAGSKAGVRLVGPNIFGYYYTPRDLCATFCTPYTRRGGIALTCQSGGVGMAIIGFTRSRGIGVSAIVGLGNKADVNEKDMLEFFAQDANTKVIAMHMEDIKDGRGFIEAARRASSQKPVVVMKVGRSQYGARAAASHTGALAGEDAVYDAAFRQAGVLRAKSLEEFLDWARVLEKLPLPKGENVLVHTSAGGLGVILSDACHDRGLKLMEVPEDMTAKLGKFVPPFGSLRNPVDITGSNTPEGNLETMRIVLKDPRVHAVVFGYWHTIITSPMVFAKCLEQAMQEAKTEGASKPVVVALSGDVEVEEAAQYLEERGVPSYPYAPEKAVSALSAVYNFSKAARNRPQPVVETARDQRAVVAQNIINQAGRSRKILTEYESKAILRAFAIPTTEDRLVHSLEEAREQAAILGFPVVLKIESPEIIHKSDIGCVRIGLNSTSEVEAAYEEILVNAAEHEPKAYIMGVSVQVMAQKGEEVIIGSKKDPTFGQIVMFGLGGVFTELLKDVSFRLAPITIEEAWNMVNETRGAPLLRGFRGRASANAGALVEVLVRISDLVAALPEIVELDINPIIVNEKSAVAVDARMVLG